MKLSEKRDKEFLEKKRRLVEKEIKKQGGAIKIFEAFQQAPTDQALRDFLIEVNYGSCYDFPGILLGETVSEEILTDAFIAGYRSTLNELSKSDEIGFANPKNPYEQYIFDKFIGRGFPYVECVKFFVDTIIERKILRLIDENLIYRIFKSDDSIDPQTGISASFEYSGLADEKDRPPITYITPFMFRKDRAICLTQWIALPSTLEEKNHKLILERKEHGVIGHNRHYANGKVIWVKPYNRRNSLSRSKKFIDISEDNYIVYLVYDADGRLRYVGEGRPERPAHVNSGASHNSKINEHFFTRGPMKIRLLHQGLTKDYAKAIESYYIQKFREQLWNIAENQASENQHRGVWIKHKLDLPILPVLDEGTDYDFLLQQSMDHI